MLKDTLDTRAVSLGNEVKDWRVQSKPLVGC